MIRCCPDVRWRGLQTPQPARNASQRAAVQAFRHGVPDVPRALRTRQSGDLGRVVEVGGRVGDGFRVGRASITKGPIELWFSKGI